MASRPPAKKSAKRGKAKATVKATRRKRSTRPWLLPLGLAFLLVLSLAMTGYLIFLYPLSELRAPQPGHNRPLLMNIQPENRKKTVVAAARNHVAADEKRVVSQSSATTPSLPRVAIIIDDMGNNQAIGQALLELDLNISFAFLPHAIHSRQLVEAASRQGRDILLHLPMEPENRDLDPGPNALRVGMAPETVRRIVAAGLAAVPLAMGINNHMGSRFTTNRPGMKTLLEFIRQKDLFFVDSMTTPDSVGVELATTLGVRAVRRHIFLDHDPDAAGISSQLQALVTLAKRQGVAVGIGHPRPATLAMLRRYQQLLQTEVRLVGIHELVQ